MREHIGVAAQTVSLFQQDDLLAGHGSLYCGHKTGTATADNNVSVHNDGVMGGDGVVGIHVDNGVGVAHLCAQSALNALVLIDLILSTDPVDGLHGTLAGAVVAAYAVFVDLKHCVVPSFGFLISHFTL